VEISHEQNGTVTIVTVIGRLDGATVPQVAAYLDARLGKRPAHLVVSLAGTSYIGSAGLRVLLSTTKAVRRHGGDLRVAAARQNVKRVFEISGFTDVIQFYPDVAAAVASF
jgi:anti-anti-sigma factor